jgi:F0F1-type ATP synthase delta subunit
MVSLSRRQLAVYAADQLLAGKRVSSIARDLAAVLVNSRRANQAELLAQDIAWELEHRGEVANATVTSAHELSEQLRKQISNFVKQSAKVNQVIINENLDESVIGGVRIETAAHSWDKTLSRKLTEVREVV